MHLNNFFAGRYQAGVTVFKNLVYAIGGCDSWNCLASVEIYNHEDDSWKASKPINTARRGCGVAVFNDKLYVVGGSDGSHSLNTVETFDEETQTWSVGPSMTTARANVEVTVVGGRLYAVGGFSGNFLSKSRTHLLLENRHLDLTLRYWFWAFFRQNIFKYD